MDKNINVYKIMLELMDLTYQEVTELIYKRCGELHNPPCIGKAVRGNREPMSVFLRRQIGEIFLEWCEEVSTKY